MAGQRDEIARPTRGGEERSAERPPSQATPAIDARASRVLGLQRAVGNRATARLLARDDTPSLLGPTPRLHLDPQFMPPPTLSLPSLGSSLPRPGQLPPLPDLHDRQPSISDYRSPAGAGAMAPDVAARLFDFRAILQSLPQPPDTITVPADPAPDTPDPFQFQAGMQWSWSAGKAAPDRTVQVQLQRGVYILQASVNIDNGQVQWLGGINPQISTREVHFLGAVISAQAFLQLLAGVTSDRGGTMQGQFTFQAAAGVQLTIKMGPITAQLQVGPQASWSPGGGWGFAFNAAPGAGPTSGVPAPMDPPSASGLPPVHNAITFGFNF
jgi:hypothetical protein